MVVSFDILVMCHRSNKSDEKQTGNARKSFIMWEVHSTECRRCNNMNKKQKVTSSGNQWNENYVKSSRVLLGPRFILQLEFQVIFQGTANQMGIKLKEMVPLPVVF